MIDAHPEIVLEPLDALQPELEEEEPLDVPDRETESFELPEEEAEPLDSPDQETAPLEALKQEPETELPERDSGIEMR